MKWWKRVFFHLIDLSIVNAWILYNIAAEKQMTHLDFWLAIAKELLEEHTPQPEKRYCVNQELPLRLTERPFSERIPKTTPSSGRLKCEVCRARGKKKLQTQVQCKYLWPNSQSFESLKTHATVLFIC